jgi:hypothetical protein
MTRIYMAAVALGLAALAGARPARACTIPAPMPHVVDAAAQAVDHVAPGVPSLKLEEIKRGQGPRNDGCSSTASSCDDIGSIAFSHPATDDRTPSDRIGYRFQVVSGKLPFGFALPSQPVVMLISDGRMWLHWLDGATDEQESLDFTLSIVAVDAAGNESPPQMLRIRDDQGGCRVATAGGLPRAWDAAIILCAVLVARLRRGKSPQPRRRS